MPLQVFYERGRRTRDTPAEEEKAERPWRQRSERCSHKSKNAGSRQKLGEAEKRLSLRDPPGLMTLSSCFSGTDFRLLASRTRTE